MAHRGDGAVVRRGGHAELKGGAAVAGEALNDRGRGDEQIGVEDEVVVCVVDQGAKTRRRTTSAITTLWCWVCVCVCVCSNSSIPFLIPDDVNDIPFAWQTLLTPGGAYGQATHPPRSLMEDFRGFAHPIEAVMNVLDLVPSVVPRGFQAGEHLGREGVIGCGCGRVCVCVVVVVVAFTTTTTSVVVLVILIVRSAGVCANLPRRACVCGWVGVTVAVGGGGLRGRARGGGSRDSGHCHRRRKGCLWLCCCCCCCCC